jgi:hypothetical protein
MWHWIGAMWVPAPSRNIITGVIGVPASRSSAGVTRTGIVIPGGAPVISSTSFACITSSRRKKRGNGCALALCSNQFRGESRQGGDADAVGQISRQNVLTDRAALPPSRADSKGVGRVHGGSRPGVWLVRAGFPARGPDGVLTGACPANLPAPSLDSYKHNSHKYQTIHADKLVLRRIRQGCLTLRKQMLSSVKASSASLLVRVQCGYPRRNVG